MHSTRETKGERGHSTRRSLLRRTLLGALVCNLLGEGTTLRAAARSQQKRYDLLIKGGRVIDPSQDLSAARDVAVLGHTIAKVAADIPEADALHVLDVRGLIVTPGLIDVHVHVYDGVAPLGIPPDPNCVAKGVTTVLDAGSAGAHTFPGFRKYVIDVAETRVRALLNISVVGQSTLSPDNLHGELLDLNYANPGLAVRTIERHRDVILGIKVRLTRNIAGENDLKALHLAREAAEAVKLPMMVHIGDTHTPLKDLLPVLRAGDVITHCFHGREGGILDEKGRVLPEVLAAVGRGVHLDVGHGAGSFAFDVAERAVKQDLLAGHHLERSSPVQHPRSGVRPGHDPLEVPPPGLDPGAGDRARHDPPGEDIRLRGRSRDACGKGPRPISRCSRSRRGISGSRTRLGHRRVGHRKLVPMATVKSGRLYGAATFPVPGSE